MLPISNCYSCKMIDMANKKKNIIMTPKWWELTWWLFKLSDNFVHAFSTFQLQLLTCIQCIPATTLNIHSVHSSCCFSCIPLVLLLPLPASFPLPLPFSPPPPSLSLFGFMTLVCCVTHLVRAAYVTMDWVFRIELGGVINRYTNKGTISISLSLTSKT